MKIAGQERIAAPRRRAWEALNDPDVLRQCIPGCQSLEKETAEKLRATVEIKIGPIGARFNSVITLSDVQASQSYTLNVEGQGGTIGSAKATIKVRLADDSGATALSYEVDAEVGGRLAQLGGPIIDATAKQLAGRFFKRFGEVIGGEKDAAALNAPGPRGTTAWMQEVESRREQLPRVGEGASGARSFPIAWILAVIVAALVGYLIGHATAPHVVLDEKSLEQLLHQGKGGAQ